ncbi:3,4-dihydroxy-2-butanone-4-phosphate synthase [Halapricum hydrolyticum]|uniref:3,4-dihydroxy-2-butanone 4-phosphate synthase n=1 Tax=Halapricum hydrolyticum TaxID=2979991 RepID=A0AAE3IC37_9EURY|nr:3,4-dihydroxy-2-butanone-4-phosphate synthase [Halapricum hydrolyticum]MCU4718974.1 3,4-dihydroxy-2-butanone-4-phosphate synthase [Halapricum hydrolyticum]MCU4727903.1 3,4-dihydroxy-2-butanone-4-phosphate synthase [Halapricum hydrolyticum]
MSTSNDTTGGATSIDQAIAAFREGEPVLVHDAADREGETDMVYPAGAVDSDAVARMRNDAGGLICVALSDGVAEAFDLPFSQDLIDHPTAADHELGYDERSSFSLTVNHRDTYTGITDEDRALTITELAEAAADPGRFDFAENFRSPGHVHLLRAAPELLDDRKGHTELGLALAEAADLPPAVVVCEMLDDETGRALSPADARAYATGHDLVYVEGRDLIERLG